MCLHRIVARFTPSLTGCQAAPEIAESLLIQDLETGPARNEDHIDALVAFMKILVDRRYKYLLAK